MMNPNYLKMNNFVKKLYENNAVKVKDGAEINDITDPEFDNMHEYDLFNDMRKRFKAGEIRSLLTYK